MDTVHVAAKAPDATPADEIRWSSPYGRLGRDLGFLPEVVLASARNVPDRAAVVDAGSGQTLSFATLAAHIEEVAAGLTAAGFGPGAVLALQAPNTPAWAAVAPARCVPVARSPASGRPRPRPIWPASSR